ncbi:hypothetical protein [Paenarthrobacter ureafaciens]|uniref:hypothetical protein n=1 Tax=Paenarthrobacter ureafaciens TaxID=37931 RepID=UPI003CF061F2
MSVLDTPLHPIVKRELDKKVAAGDLVYDVRTWGVIPNSGADVTTALNTAAADVYALNPFARLYMPAGTYAITGTLRVRCGLDASAATLNYSGTGTALIIGSDFAPNTITVRQRFELPRVINTSRGTTGWDGTSIGVKAINLNTCEVYVPFIQDFEQGLVVYGYSGGNAYNTYNLGALWENHKNLVLDTDATGYSNQNTFIGGRLQHSATKGAFVDDPDACQIYMATPYGGGPNNNVFLNVSFEGLNIGYYRLDISGKYNHFYDCRFEAPAGVNPRIRWRSTAQWNEIHGGYNTQSIVEQFDGTLGGGRIYDYIGAYTKALNTAGQVIPTGTWTKVTSWATPVGRRCTYDNAGNFTPRPGRWRVVATICFAANATGRRMARISAMGAVTDIFEAPGNANRQSLRVESIDLYDGTGTFFVEVQQTSGADLALETTAPYVKISAEYLGI